MAGKEQPTAPAVAAETLHASPGFGFGSFFASAAAVSSTTEVSQYITLPPQLVF